MSKKHFVRAAALVRSLSTEYDKETARFVFIQLFSVEPRFDEERFRKACE